MSLSLSDFWHVGPVFQDQDGFYRALSNNLIIVLFKSHCNRYTSDFYGEKWKMDNGYKIQSYKMVNFIDVSQVTKLHFYKDTVYALKETRVGPPYGRDKNLKTIKTVRMNV